MWVVSPPRPEDIAPLLGALLDGDGKKVADLLHLLPPTWAAACRSLPAGTALYGVAGYCAWRSQRRSISPLERDAWVALHQEAVGGMALRKRGAPSKRLAYPLSLSLKFTYENLIAGLRALRAPTASAVREAFRHRCDGWQPRPEYIDALMMNLSRTWRIRGHFCDDA